MANNIPSHGDPNNKVFGIIGATISTDEGKTYIKKFSDTLNVGWVQYIEPSPTPTNTPTVSITPSITPTFTPTPTRTPTNTPTPSSVDIGIFLSSNKFPVNSSPYVYTNDSSILSLPRWKLRVKVAEFGGVYPTYIGQGYEQRADFFNLNNAPIDVPSVGDYYTELYYVQYQNTPNACGTYDVLSVGPKTAVTMSVSTASGFIPPPYPGLGVYLSSSAFKMDSPAYVYSGEVGVLNSYKYKLRCKLAGTPGTDLNKIWGEGPRQRALAWNNNYSQIIPPGVGVWPVELYWITYASPTSPGVVQPTTWNTATMTISPASTFVPVTPPAYIPSNHPNVYLSTTTSTFTSFDIKNPPYIYTTDPAVLSSPAYRLRCKARYWDGSTWELLPSGSEQRTVAWNNQYSLIFPPETGSYQFELYWVKYSGVEGSITSTYSGTPYIVTAVITKDCSVVLSPTPTPTRTPTPTPSTSGY